MTYNVFSVTLNLAHLQLAQSASVASSCRGKKC